MDGVTGHDGLDHQLRTLPTRPGVYRFYDAEDRILYVGKAKNLRKRVNSYFTKHHHGARLNMLVRRIARIDFTLVASEHEALLLENNLIKQLQPKYNIALKDDKTYPYIVIKNERMPRVFFTRRRIEDGSEYFGPYTSVSVARKILDVITTLFPLRTCKLDLSQDKIDAGAHKVCLEYHIGNCLGPCEGHQSAAEYERGIENIRLILKGRTRPVLDHLKQRMQKAADDFAFEQAQDFKQRIETLEIYRERNRIAGTHVGHADVYHLLQSEGKNFLHIMTVRNGSVVSSRNLEAKATLDDPPEDILLRAIAEHSLTRDDPPEELIVPMEIEVETVTVTVPKIGAKRKLLDLAYHNLMAKKKHYLETKASRQRSVQKRRVLDTLQSDLRLPGLPRHIECFDNSNIQGSSPVAACVVFRDGKPSKKDYRTFHIRTVDGPDDFASMREVVGRRYKRLLAEEADLPDLVVIDGGKGQLNAALEALDDLGIRSRMTVVGIAKRLEEIYYPGDPVPLHINKKSESLKLLQHLRNEAHRFAIGFHRDTRSRSAFGSSLDDIPGIGPKTRDKLLQHFGSVAEMRRAPLEGLVDVVGRAKARAIKQYFASGDQ